MVSVKKGISILQDEGLTSFLQAFNQWTANKTHSVIRNTSTLNREELRQTADCIHEFSKREKITIAPWTEVFQESDYYDMRTPDLREYKFEKPYVAEVYDGRILRHNGISATESYRMILDSGKSTGKFINNMTLSDILKNKTKSKLKKSSQYDLDTAVALTSAIRPNRSSNFTNYYIWVHTYLTKLEGIENYINSTGNEVTILVPAESPSWVLQSLNFFGYDNNIVFRDSKDEMFVRKLIIPSNRRIERPPGPPDCKFLSPMASKWLREKARSRIVPSNTEFSDKVFISRNDAGRRELENRTEILNLLRDRGFVSYELSKLSFEQQVELFSQANQVIGVHGAGLVNLIFANDCRVVEILGDRLVPTYFLLTESCGLEYQAISGKSISNPTVPLHDQNIRIDPDKVANCIDRVGESKKG